MSQAPIFILCIFGFYINKMFIRLNKAKILRSTSCILFLFIAKPICLTLLFCHLCRKSHEANLLQLFHICYILQPIDSFFLLKAMTAVQRYKVVRKKSANPKHEILANI